MTIQCPQCQSERIHTRNLAKKAGGALGTAAGTASGIASALRGATAGASVGASAGSLAGPGGSLIGTVAGAILGGLVAGAAGGAMGAMLGEVVDDAVFDNFRCLACGYTFSVQDRTSKQTADHASTMKASPSDPWQEPLNQRNDSAY